MAVARSYRDAFLASHGVRFQEGFGQSWISSTCVVHIADSGLAAHTDRALVHAGIETRRWWGEGAHTHPTTTMFPRTSVPATDALARSTIALPFSRDLGPAEIRTIVE